jgi:hypothetical protein
MAVFIEKAQFAIKTIKDALLFTKLGTNVD